MGVQLAQFDPVAGPQSDLLVAGALLPTEVVESTGHGDFQSLAFPRMRGKFFVTTMRLIFVPDQQVFAAGMHWDPWSGIRGVKVKRVLWNAVASLDTTGVGGIGNTVMTTAALAGAIAKAWEAGHEKSFEPGQAVGHVSRKGLHCGSCANNPCSTDACMLCGRVLVWPGPLGEVMEAASHPEALLPEAFNNGWDTERDRILSSLRDIAIWAAVSSDDDGVQRVAALLDAMRRRSYDHPSTYGDLPDSYPASRGRREAEDVWKTARRYPLLLCEGGGSQSGLEQRKVQ
jgi:hypothetical protein